MGRDAGRHGERALQLAQALVKTPSVNPPGDVSACAGLLLEVLRRAGIPVSTAGPGGRTNVVARLRGKRSGPIVLLNGHLDVVPATEGWKVDPFLGEVMDGRLVGRGAVDMKSGLAAMVVAVEGIHRGGMKRGEVVLAAVADEETGSRYGTELLLKEGVRADFAIVGEPTDLELCIGNRGVLWGRVRFFGRASHAARPHLGANAITAAAEFVRLVETVRFHARDERFEVPEPSLTVTTIHGGLSANIVPDRVELTFDRRLMPGETPAAAELEIRDLTARLARPGITVEVEIDRTVEPYVTSESSRLVLRFQEACRRVIGRLPATVGKAATTDASLLYKAGIDTIIFGPGDPQLAHSSDESVDVQQIGHAAAIYEESVRMLTEE